MAQSYGRGIPDIDGLGSHGIRTASANPKTGDMIQTWILRSDMHPLEAIKSGSDYGICGSCIHRGSYDEFGNPIDPRTCYVNPFSFGSV